MDEHVQHQRRHDGYVATRTLLLGLTLVLPLSFLTLSFLLTSRETIGSAELLANQGFEDGTAGWKPRPLDMTFITVTEPVHSGEWAAALDRSGPTSEIYIFQDVSVVPERAYTHTAEVYKYQARFAEACLRIKWLYSTSPEVEVCVEVDYDGYRPITIALAIAPTDAITARVMAVGKMWTGEEGNPIYFDDLSFTSDPSPPPTPTPIPVYVPLVLKNHPAPVSILDFEPTSTPTALPVEPSLPHRKSDSPSQQRSQR